MTTIALVSPNASGDSTNANTKAALEEKGHTVTNFLQSAVTAGNLVAFGVIYVNQPTRADATFEGFIRDYMRTDNIPVICAVFSDINTAVTDSLVTALGIAQEADFNASEGASDAVLPTDWQDIQVAAGLDPDFEIRLRGGTDSTDEGGYIPRLKKHKGQVVLRDALENIVCFVAAAADTDFTNTSLTLGADFLFIGWTNDNGAAKDSMGIVEAFIQQATAAATFSFPITGTQRMVFRPQDLGRLVTYLDSAVSFTNQTPASTSVVVSESQDEFASFTTVAASGNEISGFVPSDPVTAGIGVFVQVILDTTVAGSSPESRLVSIVLEGEGPALRQLANPLSVEHDLAVLAKDDWYTGGLVTFLTGLNKGLSMEVRRWVNSTRTLELLLPFPFTILATDRFKVYAGCDKTLERCVVKFINVNNMRAEPYVPGRDQLIRTPDAPV